MSLHKELPDGDYLVKFDEKNPSQYRVLKENGKWFYIDGTGWRSEEIDYAEHIIDAIGSRALPKIEKTCSVRDDYQEAAAYQEIIRTIDRAHNQIDHKIIETINDRTGQKFTRNDFEQLKHRVHINRFPAHDDYFLDGDFLVRIFHPSVKYERNGFSYSWSFALPNQLDHVPVIECGIQ